ncbi:MAG: hypothetical protein LBD30_06730 [Verrucomicrobiales bacterium]|jgi:hypothetical protein|nr:hypothetical protein [Verrucomicrobiales bacterium]
MKNGIGLMKKSTWTSALDLDYLDETSAVKNQKRQVEIGKKLKQFNDYATKEAEFGRLYIGGFFNQIVSENLDGSHTSTSKLDKEVLKMRTHRAWLTHLEAHGTPRGILQHRFVVSMSKKQHDQLVAHGLNPETFLHDQIRKSMTKFREQFHRDDSIGYAYGIHHDTGNLHAHIALCPRTKKGKYVGFSAQLKGKKSASGHKNQMKFMKDFFRRENQRMTENFVDAGAVEKYLHQLQQKPNAEHYFFMRKQQPPPLTLTQNGYFINPQYQELVTMHSKLKSLNADIQQVRREMPGGFFRAFAASLLGIRKRTARRSLRQDQWGSYREIKRLQKDFFQLRKQYLRAHSRYYRPKAYGNQTTGNRNRVRRREGHQL